MTTIRVTSGTTRVRTETGSAKVSTSGGVRGPEGPEGPEGPQGEVGPQGPVPIHRGPEPPEDLSLIWVTNS